MSVNRDNLPVSREAARSYYEVLKRNPLIKEVYLKGSRSPKTKREARFDSDWDIEVTTSAQKVLIVSPRAMGVLHADVHIVSKPGENSVLLREHL